MTLADQLDAMACPPRVDWRLCQCHKHLPRFLAKVRQMQAALEFGLSFNPVSEPDKWDIVQHAFRKTLAPMEETPHE